VLGVFGGFCKCNPFFVGETCNEYGCHKYCHNKAACYVIQGDKPEESKLKVFTVVFFFLKMLL
jgi:integrin beta 2